jgi:hypothetical protein
MGRKVWEIMENNTSTSYILRWKLVVLLSLFLSACSSPLPKGEDTIKSPWNSFAEVKDAYDKIILHNTDTSGLQELGFDPYSTPNVKILSYLDIIERFSPNSLVKKEDLPPSVETCLSFREQCIAYQASPSVNKTERVGSLFKDLLKFERKEVATGWYFNALIVIDRDIAVYKIWNGVPIIDQQKSRKNPLGPIQGSLGSMAKDMAGF